jgi:hypothetical protein
MKHECGLCLRDNTTCDNGNSFLDLLLGKKTDDCIRYSEYHLGLMNKKQLEELKQKIKTRHIKETAKR